MPDDKSLVLVELGHAVAAYANDDLATFGAIIKAIHTRIVAQPTLPGIRGPIVEVNATAEQRAAATGLFLFWKEQTNHPQARPTPERLSKIMARLREGYSEAEIRKAIEGAGRDPYVAESGTRFDEIELICRNGTKLEAFIARGVTAAGPIAVDTTSSSPLEERITDARRRLAALKRAGRETEYQQQADDLSLLLQERKGK